MYKDPLVKSLSKFLRLRYDPKSSTDHANKSAVKPVHSKGLYATCQPCELDS